MQKSSLLTHRGEALLAFRSIVVREGFPALYRGVIPAAVGSVLSWAFYFHWFHRAINVISPRVTNETGAHLMAGTVAGLVTSLATNPIWVVKVRLQLQGRDKVSRPYAGFMDGLVSIAREEGVRGLYKGIGPSILLVSHGAVQFTMYERFKEVLRRRHARVESGTTIKDSLIASTASKLMASVATYPMQVARTRMQERFADGRRYGRLDTALLYIFRTEGVRGLYRGLSANVMRVTPQAAVTFVTYEQILRLCAK